MENLNLPASLYVGPTVVYGGGEGSSTTSRAPPEQSPPVSLSAATDEQLVVLLNEPQHRGEALAILSKAYKKNREMASLLWNTFNTVFILLQEVMSVYRLLSPPRLTMAESNRVCNALVLFQCIAADVNTRMGLIRARIPEYLYPFLKSTEKQLPFEYLKLTSLGVIGALVKVEDANTPQVIQFLLETQFFPLCLACMEHGSELTQTVATFIISKILTQNQGAHYISVIAERFFAVGVLLTSMINRLPPQPPLQLLKHIISCYLSLGKVPRGQANQALRRCFPARLTNPEFTRVAYEDASTRPLLEALLQEVGAGPITYPGQNQNQFLEVRRGQ